MNYKIKKWWEKNKDFVFLPAYLLLVAVLAFLAWLGIARPKPATASADYSTPPEHSYPINSVNYLMLNADCYFVGSGFIEEGLASLVLADGVAVPVYLGTESIDSGSYENIIYPVIVCNFYDFEIEVVESSPIFLRTDIIIDVDLFSILQGEYVFYCDTPLITAGDFPIGGGYEMGYESGYFAGKSDGLIAGREEVRQDLIDYYTDLIEAQKDLSYKEGYQKGKDDTKAGYSKTELEQIRAEIEAEMLADKDTFLEGIFMIFDAPVRILRECFNFELFGINVADAVFFVLTGFVVIFVIKKVKGG